MKASPQPWETATVIRRVADDGAICSVQIVSSNKDRHFVLDVPLPMARAMGLDVPQVTGVPWVILETFIDLYEQQEKPPLGSRLHKLHWK